MGPVRSRAHILSTLIAVFAAAALIACGGQDQRGETVKLIIPADASKKLESGQQVEGIPDRIEARVGDTLVVENHDDKTQFVSGFAISPNQTMEIPLHREGTYMTDCSAHEDKSIEMVVKA